MNLFQIITLPLILLLFVRSAAHLVRGTRGRTIPFLEAIIWLLAGVAILQPNLTAEIANLIGIGRGADLILYLLVLSNLISWFYFYRRLQQQESIISELVRQTAIRDGLATWPRKVTERKPADISDPENGLGRE
jgi:hypothetical protein